VAMLHSFYYSAAQTAFEEVAAEDNSCAIAAWGYASILMLNPLQGIGSSSKNAQLAQAAIDKGRKLGATTQRERDYLDAVAAYYEDFANRPERARQVARAEAYEALAAKYPDDDYGSAQRIRGFPAARAEPLSRTVRRGAGGGAVRQPRQGAAQLLQAD
jgi:hypothetical protein